MINVFTKLFAGIAITMSAQAFTPTNNDVVVRYAEEPPVVETFVEKTITTANEDFSVSITLKENNVAHYVIVFADETRTGGDTTYEMLDNGNVKLFTPDGVDFYELKINEDNTFTCVEVVEPNLPPETPVVPTIPSVDDVKDKVEQEATDFLGQFFSADVVAVIVSVIGSLITLIILAVKLFKERKLKNLTAQDVSRELDKNLKKSVEEQFDVIVPKVLDALTKQNALLGSFAKVLCLSQENTPEARLAIIEIISNLGVLKEEDTKAAKEIIEKEQAEKIENDKKVNEQLDKIVEENKDDGTRV